VFSTAGYEEALKPGAGKVKGEKGGGTQGGKVSDLKMLGVGSLSRNPKKQERR